jgi:hypothetical protein
LFFCTVRILTESILVANRKYFAEKGGLDLIIQFMNNEDVHYLELREASGYVCWAYGGTAEQVQQLLNVGAFEAIKKLLFDEDDRMRYLGSGCLCVLLQYRN